MYVPQHASGVRGIGLRSGQHDSMPYARGDPPFCCTTCVCVCVLRCDHSAYWPLPTTAGILLPRYADLPPCAAVCAPLCAGVLIRSALADKVSEPLPVCVCVCVCVRVSILSQTHAESQLTRLRNHGYAQRATVIVPECTPRCSGAPAHVCMCYGSFGMTGPPRMSSQVIHTSVCVCACVYACTSKHQPAPMAHACALLGPAALSRVWVAEVRVFARVTCLSVLADYSSKLYISTQAVLLCVCTHVRVCRPACTPG